jgi:copper(I)-binding protein
MHQRHARRVVSGSHGNITEDKEDQTVLFHSPGACRRRRLVRAGCAAIAVLIPVGAVAACGSEAPDTPGPQVPMPSIVASADNSGTSTQVGSFVDVITARIPAPPAGAGQAQLEMTLAVTVPGTSVVLTAVSSPAARHAVLLTRGHAAARISVPVQAGEIIQVGPPAPDEILLTGLREQLRLGQSVSVTMTFGRSGRATLTVPVTAAP